MKFLVSIEAGLWSKVQVSTTAKHTDAELMEEIILQSVHLATGGAKSVELMRAVGKVKVREQEGQFLVEIADDIWKKLMAGGSFGTDEAALTGILKAALQGFTNGAVTTAIMDALKKVQVAAIA